MTVVERRKRRPPLLVLAFLAVFGLVAAVNTAYLAGRAFLERAVRSVPVTEGTLAVKLAGEALLLRREAVLVAPAAGLWQIQVEPGTRVSAGARIGEILDPDLLARAQALKREVEKERADWQGDINARLSRVEAELKEVTGAIQSALAALRVRVRQGDETAATRRLEEELARLVERRTALQAEQARLNDTAVRGGSWREKNLEAERLFQAASTPVLAPVAGVVLFTLDGWEEAFDPLQGEAAVTLSEPQGAVLSTPVPAGASVAPGQILAKVVQDEPTFVKVNAEELPAVDLKPGDRVTVVFTPEGARVAAAVVAVKRASGPDTLLVKLDNAPAALAQKRTASVELVARELVGPLVPEKALVQEGEETGVYVRRGGRWRFAAVEVRLQQNGQALVAGLKAGDEVAVGWHP